MGKKRSIGIAQYRKEADLLAEHLVRQQVVSSEELALQKPGGTNNPATDADGWRVYDRWLQRKHAVHVHMTDRGRNTAGDADDLVLLDVLRGEPEDVTCVALDSDAPGAEPLHVRVYPKSFHAIIEIAQIDKTIAWLAAHLDRVGFTPQAGDLDVAVKLYPEIARLYRRLAWIVCTPGCGLPYPDEETDPTLPAWTERLDVSDLIRINAAHHRVNQLRTMYLRTLISTDTEEGASSRPSWAVFIGAASDALGIQPQRLMRDWSLAEVLLQVRSASSVKQAAIDAAKAKQPKPREPSVARR